MDKVYAVYGVAVCGVFIWCCLNGIVLFDVDSVKATRPTGPGAHYYYHK